MNNNLNNTNADIHPPAPCPARQEWKHAMVEAALGGSTDARFQEHLQICECCRQELDALRSRAAQMDATLALLAHAEPQPGFHERVMRTAEAAESRQSAWRGWLRLPRMRWAQAASALAVSLALVMLVTTQLSRHAQPSADAIASATQLARWQAPTDVLLQTPGEELLRDIPRLDESLFEVHITASEERHK